MPAKKTVRVDYLKERINNALNLPDVNTPEMRRAFATVLEDVLHATGNYHGFQFTDPNRQHDDRGLIPGTYDDTQRRYY
jgi:hypothetical protein